MKKINYETLMPIIVLGVALLIGLIIGINATNVTDNNTTTVTTEVTIELATPIDMASPTDLLESMEANEEDISTEQHIEPESLYETTTEEVTTTEYYIEPTTQDTTQASVTETPEGMTYLGTYSLTAYCACINCCGKTDAITASGTVATAGRTVACNSLPFGTVIEIEGYGTYVVEDRGGMGGNVIDIFFNDHQEAINFGRHSGVPVYQIH